MENSPETPELFALPECLPLMVLSDCYLFPGCLLPLFIFEERYRLMLLEALRSTRMFCIGLRSPSHPSGILPYSTAGMIRACRKQPDGTSHLMLYGVQRVQFTGYSHDKPYVVANVVPVPTLPADPESLSALQSLALASLPQQKPACAEMIRTLRDKLIAMDDPAKVCDILTFQFVRRKEALDLLLAETCPITRYEILINELRRPPGFEPDVDDDDCSS